MGFHSQNDSMIYNLNLKPQAIPYQQFDTQNLLINSNLKNENFPVNKLLRFNFNLFHNFLHQ